MNGSTFTGGNPTVQVFTDRSLQKTQDTVQLVIPAVAVTGANAGTPPRLFLGYSELAPWFSYQRPATMPANSRHIVGTGATAYNGGANIAGPVLVEATSTGLMVWLPQNGTTAITAIEAISVECFFAI